jgi:hypothetical protein
LDLSDVEELVASAQMAGDYINLGIEYLAGRQRDEGKRIIREVYLVQLFRLGYTLVLAERKKNEVFVRELSNVIDPAFWGDFARNVVKGLLDRKPLFYEGLAGGRADYRNFRSTADIALSADFIAQLSARVNLIREIIDIPDDIGPWLLKNAKTYDWGLEHLFMTAFVRACISGEWEITPLATEELARFYDILKENPGITDTITGQVETFIGKMPESKDEKIKDASMRFVNNTVTGFIDDMMRIADRDAIDERFVSGVITSTPP